MTAEGENRQNPRDHWKCWTLEIKIKRQNDIVSLDTFPPTIKSSQGNTCSQIFYGETSRRWELYPLKTESRNVEALQDYTRQNGTPHSLESDNSSSEIGNKLLDHCRTYCIGTETTEP
eukprot:8261696-Ditylum_brightwellii.AAC.1